MIPERLDAAFYVSEIEAPFLREGDEDAVGLTKARED